MTEIEEQRVERRETSIGNGYFVRNNGPLYGWGLHDEDGDRVAVFKDEWSATTFATITNRKTAIALSDQEAAARGGEEASAEARRLVGELRLATWEAGSRSFEEQSRTIEQDIAAEASAEDALLRHIARAEAGGAVAGGWQQVPKEPTPEMIEAGRWPAEDDGPFSCWAAMVAAAPWPPAVGSEQDGGSHEDR